MTDCDGGGDGDDDCDDYNDDGDGDDDYDYYGDFDGGDNRRVGYIYSGCPVAIQGSLLLNYSQFEPFPRVPPLFSTVVGVIHVSRRGEGESLSFRFELACMRVSCLDCTGYSFFYYFYYFGDGACTELMILIWCELDMDD